MKITTLTTATEVHRLRRASTFAAILIAIAGGCSRQPIPAPDRPALTPTAHAASTEHDVKPTSKHERQADAVPASPPSSKATKSEPRQSAKVAIQRKTKAAAVATAKAPPAAQVATTSPLLDRWSGDSEAMPNAELIDEGWTSLKTLAEQGNVEAQFRLGALMLMTEPTPSREFERKDGLPWVRRAAEQGHGKAAGELAGFYFHGFLIEQNRQEAERLYAIGAKAKDPLCQYFFGLIQLERGDDSGVSGIRAAAESGFTEAQCKIAEMHMYGEGVKKDKSVAIHWYRKAAEKGNAIAQYNTGMTLHFDGQTDKAKPWLGRAAKQGYVDAMTNLSVIYFNESEFDRAEQYADFAIAHGSIEAISMRSAIQRQRLLEERVQEGIYSSGFSGF